MRRSRRPTWEANREGRKRTIAYEDECAQAECPGRILCLWQGIDSYRSLIRLLPSPLPFQVVLPVRTRYIDLMASQNQRGRRMGKKKAKYNGTRALAKATSHIIRVIHTETRAITTVRGSVSCARSKRNAKGVVIVRRSHVQIK